MQSSVRRSPAARLGIVLPAGALLMLGMYAGLQLLGIPLPAARLADLHAPLMILGFVTTLISLERAVALRALWAFLAPVLTLLGSLMLLHPTPAVAGPWAITAGVTVHALQYVAIWRRQPMTATAIQGLGAASGVCAALLWSAGVPVPRLVPLLMIFLVLTVAGERLELARLASPGIAAERMLLAAAVLTATAALVAVVVPVLVPVFGIGLLLLMAWLLRHDVIRMTIRQRGLPRFVAICMYFCCGWLGVAGAGLLLAGTSIDSAVYDATTHAVFLGYVITAIMAHAPVILPAVLGVQIPYHPVMLVPVALLQASLLVRVVGGDAWGIVVLRQAGGIGSVAAIVLFIAIAATLALRGRRSAQQRRDARVTA